MGDYFHYAYDSVGNRLSEVTALATTTYAYDEANRLSSADGVAYTWDANGNLLSDGVNTYTYDSANRLVGFGGQDAYVYNGLGDRLSYYSTTYTLDLAGGLPQVLNEGTDTQITDTYIYGQGRIADDYGYTEYYLGDALGSLRQVVDEEGLITLTRSYAPYGEVIDHTGYGYSNFGFTGEMTDDNGLVYLRARYYSPGVGRFISRDTWGEDINQPMSYNAWLYVYANPIIWTDPTGFSAEIYGIQVDDNFSDDEISLISETISDYIQLFGSQERLTSNLALSAIKQGWTNYEGAYNAQYDWITHTITLQPGWYSPVITQAPNGEVQIILAPLCGENLERALNFPKGSLPTAKVVAQFVLAHEMGHSFQIGNPEAFRDFRNSVDLPWSIFAGFSKNPIIRRNTGRVIASEVFADMIAAYLYSPGLLNQQMSDWIQIDMPTELK